MSTVSDINAIIDCVVLEGFSPNLRSPHRSFGLGKQGISFQGEGARTFATAVTKLFEANAEVHRTITKKRFEQQLISALRNNFQSQRHVDGKEVAEFYSGLTSEKCSSFAVFREIHGVTLQDASPPIALGPFTIYRFEKHKSIIESRAGEYGADLITMKIPTYLAEVAVRARHSEKAFELADRRFAQLDSVLRFVVGGNIGKWDGGVLGAHGPRPRDGFVIANDGDVLATFGSEGSYVELPLDDQYFVASDSWHRNIWNYLSQDMPSEMQKRVVLAINWIGQAHGESSKQMAFIKAAISLEVIFTHNERSIINASVLHHLSESVALLIGKDLNHRKEIESRVKDLYSQRSSIAHSGSSDILEADLQDILSITREVMAKFLNHPNLIKIKRVQELYDLLRCQKYSCGEI